MVPALRSTPPCRAIQPIRPPYSTCRDRTMTERISRRDLLRRAGTAAAATGLAGAGAARRAEPEAPARRKPPGEQLVGALIGCGGMGRGNMANLQNHGVQIAAVCDVDEEHARQAAAEA